MKSEKLIIIILIGAISMVKAQDSSFVGKKPARPHEIGFSASTVFFLLAGVSDYNERYTNITYRYFLKEKHALKFFTGANVFNPDNTIKSELRSVNQSSVYATTEKKTPSNFQLGLGYEYILGKGKLKHVIGVDLLYNNKFERENFYFMNVKDSINSKGNHELKSTRVDTGAYLKTNNYNKFGLNLSYSLRYRLSKKWVITAGMLLSYKTYRRKETYGYTTVGEGNFNGIISDVSVFYTF